MAEQNRGGKMPAVKKTASKGVKASTGEQKASTRAQKPSTGGGKTAAGGQKAAPKKETTKMAEVPRFGDSILDEVILILVILVSIVGLVSLWTEKMGLLGQLFGGFLKGLLGFGGLLLPVFAIVYCVWFLADEERRFPLVRAFGGILFLLAAASAAALINPVDLAEGTGFLRRCGALYKEGTLGNGGLLGGLLGGGLHRILDTLGSVIVLAALLVISVIMATGRSFFYAIGDIMAHRKARQRVKNEKIKNKAERIRQQERLEEERLAKREEVRRRKVMHREDFNIELKEGAEKTDEPYVRETVFRKKPAAVEAKKREPIYDFGREEDPVIYTHSAPEPEEYREPFTEEETTGLAEETAAGADMAVNVETPETVMEHIFAEETEDGGELPLSFEIEDEPFEEDEPPTEAISFEAIPEEQIPEEEIPEEKMPEGALTKPEPKEQNTPEPEPVPEPEPEKPYIFPPIQLLGEDPQNGGGDSKAELLANAKKLETTLKSFGVEAKVIQINKGPTVTRYELSPSQGVKVSKIVNLADDIALNLAASGIRIEAPIPGKAAVGIEVPNKETQSVYLRTVLESEAFKEHSSRLAFALGEDIAGNPVVTDIAKMPHLLIAGATGSGKSVCINTLITSILYKAKPDEVKLLLVDPKVVELSVYNGIPHLLIPVVTDPKKASAALNWAVREMLQRYNDFAANGVRDIKGFNAMMEEKGDPKGKMSQIVIIIDELADLMMAAPGEVEDAICRLAQMARAAGMHLIIATQRPSVDVITGVIKANIPSRLAFAVSSGIDSRTILDTVGAEKLLGKGDMLFYPSGQSKPARLQGAFVTDREVEDIVDFLRKSGRPNYDQQTIDQITTTGKVGGDDGEADEFFEAAVELVLEKEKASVSMLQRQFRIGYNRAARLMDDLERRGIVGPEEGSKPRRVLITRAEWEGDGEE